MTQPGEIPARGMAEEEKDAAYSDEEFRSEHEYEGGDDEFDDEDTEVNTVPVGEKMDSQVGDGVEDADYGGEFDEDDTTIVADPPSLTINERPMESTRTNTGMMANAFQEDTALYDEEFDEDDAGVVDVMSPSFERNETTVERALDMMPLDGNESPDSPNDQIDESDNDDVEYSNDLEHDTSEKTMENISIPKNPFEETVTQRRSSVPIQLSDDFRPNARIVRADSMPMVLPTTSLEIWMDAVPQELSPERHDRSRKLSACFPVQEEQQQQKLADDENDTDDINNDVPTYSGLNTATSRTRAQSYQNLLQKKIAVPIRRAQSLLYVRSLPSVEEINAAEETDPEHNQEGEYSYSDDEDNYDEDSHASSESEHDKDAVNPTISAIVHSIASEGHPATNITGDYDSNTPILTSLTSMATPDKRILPNEGSTSETTSLQNSEDDYADEMENELPNPKTLQLEGEDTLNKSDDEAGDYYVDEFIEDGRRETDTLLQEARILLEQQQNEIKTNEQFPNKQNGMPPDTSTLVEIQGQTDTNLQTMKESEAERFTSTYDDDDEFADADALNQETLQQIITEDHSEFGQYEFDADDFENPEMPVLPHEEPREIGMETANDSSVSQTVPAMEDTQPPRETMCIENSEVTAADEAIIVLPLNAVEDNVRGSPAQLPETSQPDDSSSVTIVTEQGQKNASVRLKGSPKQSQPDKGQVASQLARPKRLIKKGSPLKQSSQVTKPSRPPAKKATPAPPLAPSPSSVDVRKSPTALRHHNRLKNISPDSETTNSIGSSGERATPNPSPERQASPPKTKQKVSSPRLPSNACSDPYQYLPNDPQHPRKEPVPRQKVSSSHSTRGEHGSKRRQLQPVRTPANLRFNLPKMDKTKRDWLFANMFRHGDDMSKYEAFVSSTLLAKPPTTSRSNDTKKRPLSAHHIYGTPHTARFVSPSRKLVPQPNPAFEDRERNWVATTPHDSKLPSYDSILDKYCTAVTNPMVQRHIYQTRHQDLSPQLAFVLEKRVEKSCRKGFYDSFGGVSSYKTEIMPTSASDSTRQRQISPRPPTKSGMLERHATNSTTAQELRHVTS